MSDVPDPAAKPMKHQSPDSVCHVIFEAFNRAGQGMAAFDTDLRLTMFNDTFVEYLELSAGSVGAGVSLRSLVHSKTAPRSVNLESFKTLVEGCAADPERSQDARLECTLANGRIVETCCHAVPGRGVVTTQTDVTEQKRAETRLEDAIQSLAEGFMLWDAEDRLVSFNDKIREFYPGIEDILVVGRHFEDNIRESLRRGLIALPAGVDPEEWIVERIKQHRNPASPLMRRTVHGRWLRIVEHKTAEGGIVGVVVDVTNLKDTQDTLRERERRLKMAVSGTQDGLWDWNLVSGKIWYSPVWRDMIGFSDADMKTYRWIDHVHPQDLAAAKTAIVANLKGDSDLFEANYRHRHKNGRWIWIEARGTCIRDDQNKPARFTGRMTDISRRMRSEDALRKSQASLANAQRIAKLGNWDLDVDRNAFTWSDEIYRIFGLEPQSTPASYDEFLDIVHADDRDKVRRAVHAALYENAECDVEHRIVRPDGSVRMVRHRGEVTFDGAGDPLKMTGTIQDITEQRRAEQTLLEYQERFRHAFQTSPDAVTVTRLKDGLVVDVNDGLTSLFGYEKQEVLGKKIAKVRIWADLKERKNLVARLREKNQVQNLEIRVRHRDGQILTGMMSASTFVLNGEPHILSIVRDITVLKRTEEELRKLWRAVEQSAAGVIITCTDGTIEYVNPKFTEMTGYTREEVVGHNPRLLKSGDVTRGKYKTLWSTILKGREWRGELRNRRKDGTLYWASASISPVKDPRGNVRHFIGIQEDITVQKQAEEKLRASEERFRCLVESSVLGIVIEDEGTPVFSNQTFADIFGYASPEDIIALGSIDGLYTPTDLMRIRRYRNANLRGQDTPQEYEFQGVKKDGSLIWVRAQLNLIPWNGASVIQSTVVDITLRKTYEERLHYQANFDAVTDLPNRTLALDRLNSAVARARRYSRKVGILFIDLDHFKKINDTLGHALGDQLLKQSAQRLTSCVREEDTVARLGGDEFTVILQDMGSSKDAESVARKILMAFSRPFVLDGNEAFVSTSVGITLCPDDGSDAELLMRNADAAMYQAKEQGRNTLRFFTPRLNERALERIHIESRLRRALDRKQFVLHFQPLMEIRSGRPIGAEALLRWRESSMAAVRPERFVRLAEETGLIVPIGEWVLYSACKHARLWKSQGLDHLRVSVNVSSRQFKGKSLVDAVTHALKRNRLTPDSLELEITEGLLMDDLPETKTVISKLEANGIRLAVDDFGTGYSSLRYLNRFPLDTLKIDRSFIQDVPEDEAHATLVEAMIAMAHRLNLMVIAEGVETKEQLDFLKARDCDVAQGHYFSPALPAQEFVDFVRKWDTGRTPAEERATAPPQR